MKRATLLLLCACGPTLSSESTSGSSGSEVPPDLPTAQTSTGGSSGSSGSSDGSSAAALDTSSTSSGSTSTTGCEQMGTAYRACDPTCDCSDGMICRGEDDRASCTILCETATDCPPTGFPPPWDEPICVGTCAVPCAPGCPNPSVYACIEARCLPLF